MKLWKTSGGLVLASLLGLGFAACGGDKDNGDGDGDSAGDGDGDGDGDISLGGNIAGDGDGDGDGDATCGGEDVEAEPLAANVLLVIDTSESMDETPSGFTNTKWATLVSSLKTALPEVQDLLSLGAKTFPSGDTGADICSVEAGIDAEIAAGAEAVTAITDVLDAEERSGDDEGDTPTAAALAEALDYFQNGAGKDLEGNNYVLLATDGGPNCSSEPQTDCTCDGDPSMDSSCGVPERCTVNVSHTASDGTCSLEAADPYGSCCLTGDEELCLDDGNTIDAVEALEAAGIKTIVLGMPGTEAYTTVLDSLAEAGGLPASDTSPKFHKVDDPAGLTEALRDITRSVIRSCEIQLEMDPPNLNQVNVYLDGTVIPKDDADGWKYDMSTSPITIVLTGPTCEEVEQTGVEKISVKFGCTTVVK